MRKFTVTVHRTKRETAKVEVEAKDKRSAALHASAKLDGAEWIESSTTEIRVAAIDVVKPVPLPEPVSKKHKAA